MIYFWDTEATGLLYEPDLKIHCLSVQCKDFGHTYVHDVPMFFELLQDGDTIVAHNQFGYDLELMRQQGIIDDYSVLPDSITVQGVKKEVQLLDTLAMSRAWFPDLPGGHGLAAYAERLNGVKPVVEDWKDQPIEVYVERCEADTVLTEQVFNYLCERLDIKYE